jgi:hypothetical protein
MLGILVQATSPRRDGTRCRRSAGTVVVLAGIDCTLRAVIARRG